METLCYYFLRFSIFYLFTHTSFFSQLTIPPSLCSVFNVISSDTGEVLLVNHSANVFVFGNFNILHKYWLTYSDGADASRNLNQTLKFLTRVPECDDYSLPVSGFFLVSDSGCCFIVFLLASTNLDHDLAPVSFDLPISLKDIFLFIA